LPDPRGLPAHEKAPNPNGRVQNRYGRVVSDAPRITPARMDVARTPARSTRGHASHAFLELFVVVYAVSTWQVALQSQAYFPRRHSTSCCGPCCRSPTRQRSSSRVLTLKGLRTRRRMRSRGALAATHANKTSYSSLCSSLFLVFIPAALRGPPSQVPLWPLPRRLGPMKKSAVPQYVGFTRLQVPFRRSVDILLHSAAPCAEAILVFTACEERPEPEGERGRDRPTRRRPPGPRYTSSRTQVAHSWHRSSHGSAYTSEQPTPPTGPSSHATAYRCPAQRNPEGGELEVPGHASALLPPSFRLVRHSLLAADG